MPTLTRLRSLRGLGGLGTSGSAPPPPLTLLDISDLESTDGDIQGDKIGTFVVLGGVSPYTYSLTVNPSNFVQVSGGDGSELQLGSATPSYPSMYGFTARVTDDVGQTLDQAFTADFVVTTGNESGIGEGDVTITVADEMAPEYDGDGFEISPVTDEDSTGLVTTGRNKGVAHFFLDLGPPDVDVEYIIKYEADFSEMSKNGSEAAVGFCFKNVNDFHCAGIRGDGVDPGTTMLASQIFGDFRKPNTFTKTNDGAANNGTVSGPNWLKLNLAQDGTTYDVYTSADGVSWDLEYTAESPTPLTNVDDSLQFGIGGYFDKNDTGVFQITITNYTTNASMLLAGQRLYVIYGAEQDRLVVRSQRVYVIVEP